MTRILSLFSSLIFLFLFFSPRVVSDYPKGEKSTPLSAGDLARLEKLAGNDANKLLDLAAQVDAKEGRRILQKVVSLFTTESPPQAEALFSRRRLAQLVQRLANYPEQINEIFSPSAPKGICRQVLYHQFIEQWHYHQPIQIIIIFGGTKGKELRLLTVQLIPPTSS